jgi:RNA polymerase sigma-70 factor (ECF subfamily)
MIPLVDTMDETDISLLVQRAQAGSIEAFDMLVKRYEGGIYKYLMCLLRNHEDACDYTQQVFLKAWLNLASLKTIAYFNVWLYAIARNLVRDYWRVKKLSCLSWEELFEDSVDMSTRGPEEHTVVVELMRLALAELAPKLRYCLILREVCGYHPHEIAGMVNISITSVSTYISMARRQLRVILESDERTDR